jgi:hypothetical protein
MKVLFAILQMLGSFDPHNEYSPRELEEKRAAVSSWEKLAEQTVSIGDDLDKYIAKLGDALLKTSPKRHNPALGGEDVHLVLKAKLLSIPGHAEHFRDRINSSREEMEAVRDSPNPSGILGGAIVKMNREQSWGFQTLRDLPSPETVRVLGDFLSDDRGAELSEERRQETGETPNSRYAVSALSKLGIANPPTPPVRHTGDVTDGMESWRQWYSEIESGRRTVRFIGDDTEYDLRGPVRRSAGMDSDRTGKRTKITTPSEERISEASPTPMRFLPYLIGGLFLLAGLGVYLRGKHGA